MKHSLSVRLQNRHRARFGHWAILTALVLLLTACGGSDTGPGSGTDTEPPPQTPPAAVVPAESLLFNGQQTGNFEIYRVAKAGVV
ncbi:MAG: hypothetical protein AB8C46_08765 [Burkholderiaceae bacterium]